jgi:hypothetical protein
VEKLWTGRFESRPRFLKVFRVLRFGMRKLLVLVALVVALGGGVYLATSELLLPDRISRIYFGVGGAMLASWAAYSLWLDFIAPILGIAAAEE